MTYASKIQNDMMSNTEIDKKVKATLDSVESIKSVKVSPFLKDRIMHQLDNEKVDTSSIWSWFTPSLQLTALVLFVVLNVFAYMNMNSEDYNSSIDEFTETFDLVEEENTSIF